MTGQMLVEEKFRLAVEACPSGMIMSAAALLSQKKKPTEEEVRSALDGNLCRCGTYQRVVRAVMAAAG